MKKILSAILILTMAFSAFCIIPASADSESDKTLTSGNFKYEIKDDGTVLFKGYMGDAIESLVIPSEIDGKKVTEVSRIMQNNHFTLKSVVIPEGVKTMGKEAFSKLVNLEKITLPDSVTDTYYRNLDQTKYYRNDENWTDGVLYIGNHLIKAKTSLEGTYTVKAGTISIFNGAFGQCGLLNEVVFPDTLKRIGEFTFEDCLVLEKATLPDSVESIGIYAFEGCSALRELKLSANLETISYGAFRSAAIDKLEIPAKVTKIDGEAFANCRSLKEVIIPEGVKELGYSVFSRCESLRKISLPKSLEYIGDCICHNTAYHNDESNWVNGALYIGDILICVKDQSANINVKEGTRLLPRQAFSNNTNIVSVTLPESVEQISSHCFAYSYKLRSVKLPENLKSIGGSAFEDCVALEGIVIPDGVTEIGDSAFLNCTELKYIEIPASVENIGNMALGYYNPYFAIDGMPVVPESYPILEGFVIAGYKGTAAEEYAKENNIRFEDLSAPTQFKYKDKVLELLSTVENPDDPTAMWHYEEVYEHTGSNTATADYVLIRAYAGLVNEADFTYYFKDYIMYESSTSTPAEFGYFVYLPAENKIYTLIDAFEKDIPHVYDIFTEGILGDLAGDVNFDKKLNIKDTSLIQKHLAKRNSIYEDFHRYFGFIDYTFADKIADFNRDGKLNIRDATAIQKTLAGIDLNDPEFEDIENIAYENSITHVDVTVGDKTYDLRSDEIMTVEVYLDCEVILSNLSFEFKMNPDSVTPQKKGKDSKYLENHCPNIPEDSTLKGSLTYTHIQTPEGEYDFTEKKLLHTMQYKVNHDYDTDLSFKIHHASDLQGVTVCNNNHPLRNTDINLTYNVKIQRLPRE